MNNNILKEAGLTATQATAYIILVKNSPCTPPHLAELIKESRTNTYKVLEQLELIGLVSRDETHKKLRYWANNPSLLIDKNTPPGR
jgi:sugar-specific transcriptional regulator TrmB